MQEKSNDYEFCIRLTLDNAKKRINLLEDSNKKCVMEEYREWPVSYTHLTLPTILPV